MEESSSSIYFDSDVAYLHICSTAISLVAVLVAIICKFTREYDVPKLWKIVLLATDFAYQVLGVGLVCFYVHYRTDSDLFCKFTGFFIQLGICEVVCAYFNQGAILLGIYNPGTVNKLSNYHKNVFLVLFVPQQILSILFSLLPTLPISYFEDTSSNKIPCYNINPPGAEAAEFGIFLWLMTWITIIIAIITTIIGLLKHGRSLNNRIHSVSSNVWQAYVLNQGKVIQIASLVEIIVTTVVLLLCSGSVFTGNGYKTKIFYISLCVTLSIHSFLSLLLAVMWGSCCCRKSTAVDETYRKLKRLDLVRIDAPGKIRLRALWNISKGSVKRGLMKVYGPNHLKAWAQEIVVLGMLRKVQHPSLLQCLWTSSSNPYYETMTLITGEVVSSDSRIICLELTNSGTLQDFLHRLDTPLPETCQRMVVHDIAEGLAHLHEEGILHSNLTTASIYLKGSLPTQIRHLQRMNMVMRAAIGDFEFSQIYGSVHQNNDSIVDKRHFFTPDIRSFALIALEIVSKMCEKTFVNMQYDWDIEEGVESMQSINYAKQSSMQGGVLDQCGSDTDNEFTARKLHQGIKCSTSKKSVMTPAEVIEEIGRRSRSMSPGSRPMSAQSTKSRSRTLSPVAYKASKAKSPSTSTYNSRVGTPDSHVILPEDEYPNDIHMPNSPKQLSLTANPENNKTFKSTTRSEIDKIKRPKTPSQVSSGSFVFEAFAPDTKKSKSRSIKKIDSKKWLNKPSSFIKSLTGSETSVSVFKSKHEDKEDSAEEISDEEIETMRQHIQHLRHMRGEKMTKSGILHRTSSKQSDQWSIPGDMEYRYNGLKSTVSADSRSSMWSNLPLPLEMIDIEGGGEINNFQNIVDCLPGMTDPLEFSKPSPSLQEMLEARIALSSDKKNYWKNDLPGPSQFELIDYYDELQGKYVKRLAPKGFHRTMSGSQILPASVHRTFSGTQVLHKTNSGLHEILEQAESLASDDEGDNKQTPLTTTKTNTKQDKSNQKIKPKLLKEENLDYKTNEEQHRIEEKQKSAKRKPRSKSMKEISSKSQNLVAKKLDPEEAAQNRAKARKALNKALKTKGPAPMPPILPLKPQKNESKKHENSVKYAKVKKLPIKTLNAFERKEDTVNFEENISDTESYYQETNLDHPEITDLKKITNADVQRFHSFSSNDSCISSVSNGIRFRHADISLTSGELTSLSSHADPDTDEQNTDVDMASREALLYKKIQQKAKMVDSGFDSESSELSSEHFSSFRYKHKSIDSTYNCGSGYQKVHGPFAPNRHVTDITTVSIDNNTLQGAETTFCVTGFNSQMDYLNKSLGHDYCEVEEEIALDADDGFNEGTEEIYHSNSGMSRISVSTTNQKHSHCPKKEHVTTIKVKPKQPQKQVKTDNSDTCIVYSSPNKAIKRYRDLTQKGVPLRVSVIDGDSSEDLEKISDIKSGEKKTNVDNLTDDQKLFDQLDSTGFFQSQKKERQQSSGIYPTGHLSRRDLHLKKKHKDRTIKSNKLPLEDIIREIPEETSPSPCRKLPNKNQKQDNPYLSPFIEDTMLNQPSSSAEDNDGLSSVHGQVLRNSPVPPRSVSPKAQMETVVVDAELYIDRIYSNNSRGEKIQKPIPLMDPDFDMPLPFDRHGHPLIDSSVIQGHSNHEENECVENDYMDIDMSLLSGVNDQHVKACQLLTHDMHLLKFNDLLPAKLQSFEKLKNKLYQGGNLGHIGFQILDVIQKCWLSELPPSSADLVLQLLDPVTETEL